MLKFPHIFPHILLLPFFLTIFLTFTFLTFSLHFSSHLPCEESGQFPALMWGNFCEEKVWKMWGNIVENVRKFPHFFLTFSSHWIFIVYGIPQVLVSDNGPQFISKEFKLFTKNWGMLHELSSPYHPQSNGKAESAVKTVKSLMSKAEHSGSDLFLMLLEYRNTPTQALGSSPAQRMLCRSIRSKIPVRVDALQQKPVEMDELATRLERTQKRQAESYNQGAKA